MRICVIIPAAGKSERFGPRDKLDEDLGGRPMLLRTVELFTKREEVGAIVVAAPPDSLDQFRFRYGDRLGFHGATIVPGGKVERWETVRNALEHIPDGCTHVAVHDAARPAASAELLDRVFEAARKFDAVVPAVRVNSTLKRVGKETAAASEADPIAAKILGEGAGRRDQARKVVETIDRDGVMEAQTPQVFTVDLLKRAYAQGDLSGVTDDAQAVERLGEAVWVVDGDPRNIKVTTPADLHLVRAILGVRGPQERPVHKRF